MGRDRDGSRIVDSRSICVAPNGKILSPDAVRVSASIALPALLPGAEQALSKKCSE
jgi:hypothetical protein